MDAVSYANSAKQAKRIKKFIENPDSDSGIVTTPKVIKSGETITIPNGRMAVLPDLTIEGDLVLEGTGDVFIPAGSTLTGTVTLDTAQTITGPKEFTTSPKVPDGAEPTDVVNKGQLDSKETTQAFARSGLAEGTVTVEGGTVTIDIHDIFEDGSVVATYQLNGNANDLGNAYNGTAINATYGAGKFGQGISAGVVSIQPYNTDLTHCVSLWVKVNSNNGSRNTLLALNKDKNVMLSVDSTNNSLFYSVYQDASNNGSISIPYTNGEFAHIVISRSRTTGLRAYKNGILVGVNTYAGLTNDPGCDYSGFGKVYNSNTLDVIIDQVRIFNRELTEAEITTLYLEQKDLNLNQVQLSNGKFIISNGFNSNTVVNEGTKTLTISGLQDGRNFVKFNGTTYSATQNEPVFGTDNVFSESDTYINGKWYSKIREAKENIHDIFGDNSAVATYQLNGNADDLGGTYNGTPTNLTYEDGKFGQGALFSVGASYIALPNLGLAGSSLIATFSMWIKPNLTSNRFIFGYGTNAASQSFNIMVNTSGNIGIDNNGSALYINNYSISNDRFYLITVVTNGNNKMIYVDGKYIGVISILTNTSNSNYTIGNRPVRDEGSESDLDQVRIFNRALTQDEITTLYYEGTFSKQAYNPQIAYLNQGSKLVEVEQTSGELVGLHLDKFYPEMVVNSLITTGNRKVIELGTIFNNNRYVVDNPFGNDKYMDCDAKLQLFINSKWSKVGNSVGQSSTTDVGCICESMAEGLVIQTAEQLVYGVSNNNALSTSGIIGVNGTNAPARVIVTYVGVTK